MTENIDHSNTTPIPDPAAKQRRKKLLIGLGSIVLIGSQSSVLPPVITMPLESSSS